MVSDPRQDERLADWVDGELPARELERFEAELRVNPELAAVAEEYRLATERVRGVLAGGSDENVRAPEGMADRVLASLDSRVLGGLSRFRIPPWVGSAAAAAAIVLVFFVVRAWNGDQVPIHTRVAGRPETTETVQTKFDFESGSARLDSAGGLSSRVGSVGSENDLVDVHAAEGDDDRLRAASESVADEAEDVPTNLAAETLDGSTRGKLRDERWRTEDGDLSAPGTVLSDEGRRKEVVGGELDALAPNSLAPSSPERMVSSTRRTDGPATEAPTESQPVVVFELPSSLAQRVDAVIQAGRVDADTRRAVTDEDVAEDVGEVRWRSLSCQIVQVPIEDIVRLRRAAPRLRMVRSALPPRRQAGGGADATDGAAERDRGASRSRRSTEYRSQDGDLLFELRGHRPEVRDYLAALSRFARRNRGAVALERVHPEQVREIERLGLVELSESEAGGRAGWPTDPRQVEENRAGESQAGDKIDFDSLRIRDRSAPASTAGEGAKSPANTTDPESRTVESSRHRVWIVLRQRRDH